MIDKLFILFRLFRDLSWKKKFLILVVLSCVLSPVLPHDNDSHVESTSSEPTETITYGAGDFKVPGGFSELNKEVGFAQYEDSLGQTITITKLDNQTDYMDTWFTNMSYTTHVEIVKPAVETDIDNLYSVDEISDWDWIRGYVELVEFKGDRYIVQVNEYENLYDKDCPLAFMYDLVQDMEYINKENKLTPIEVV